MSVYHQLTEKVKSCIFGGSYEKSTSFKPNSSPSWRYLSWFEGKKEEILIKKSLEPREIFLFQKNYETKDLYFRHYSSGR